MHTTRHPGKPLAGLKVLDVGCGGGLLTEVSVCLRQMQPQCEHGQKYLSLPPYSPCPLPIVSIPTFHVTQKPFLSSSMSQCKILLSVHYGASSFTDIPVAKNHRNVSLVLVLF